MVKFFADAGWELDLTDSKIQLIEENDLFFDYFINDYSFPTTSPVSKFKGSNLEFLANENTDINNNRFTGKLFIDCIYKNAVFKVQGVKGEKAKFIIYYGSTIIPVLSKQLNQLSFDRVEVNSLVSHASSVITKSYPEVSYNFPMIIDENFKENTGYDAFEGILNNYKSSGFVQNGIVTIDNESVIQNKNVLTPIPYLLSVLQKGFYDEGLILEGDFVSDPINKYILWDTNEFIEQYSQNSVDSHIFSNPKDEYIIDGEIVSEFEKQFYLNITGSYKLKLYLNLPETVTIKSFTVKFKDEAIFESTNRYINKDIDISIPDNNSFGYLKIELLTNQVQDSIYIFNKFEVETTGDKLNVFNKSFSLADVMPEMTFGSFLNWIKTRFGLRFTKKDNVVRLDYIYNILESLDFVDRSVHEIPAPYRKPYKYKLIKLEFSKDEYLHVDKNGLNFSPEDYTKSEIEIIKLNTKTLPILEQGSVFTAKRHKKDSKFRLLLYNGLQNGLPVAVESVDNNNLSLKETYNFYYKLWCYFLLNATVFNDSFDSESSEFYTTEKGQYKYNEKQIIKSIRKKRKSENVWTYTIEALSIKI